jgi:hypothetical protein
MIRKHPYEFLLFPILLSFTNVCFSQRVENVRPEIIDDKIHLYYDLADIPADQPVFVRVYLSIDGGLTYGEPLISVSGDVGMVIGPGKNKHIIWDVFEEVDELVSENVKFRIKADLLQSDREKRIVTGYSFNLNAELGSRVKLNAYGFNLKVAFHLKQLGLGVRGHYYRSFEERPDNSGYWGFSGGAIIEYDFIRDRRYSLYPFMYLGQTKIHHVQESLVDEHSGYSIFYSPGAGFNINVFRFLYLGIELEYYMAPRIDIINRGSGAVADNIIMDGISVGIVVKFVIHPE